MTNPLIALGKFTRDLLVRAEGSVVIIGRTNMRRDDFTGLQIVIDQLGGSRRVASGQKYVHTTELMTYDQAWSMAATVDFYGDGALAEAHRFAVLLQSERALDLKRSLGIAIYRPSQITNVKLLTDEAFSERQQIELNITYEVTAAAVATDYITTARTDITTES